MARVATTEADGCTHSLVLGCPRRARVVRVSISLRSDAAPDVRDTAEVLGGRGPTA